MFSFYFNKYCKAPTCFHFIIIIFIITHSISPLPQPLILFTALFPHLVMHGPWTLISSSNITGFYELAVYVILGHTVMFVILLSWESVGVEQYNDLMHKILYIVYFLAAYQAKLWEKNSTMNHFTSYFSCNALLNIFSMQNISTQIHTERSHTHKHTFVGVCYAKINESWYCTWSLDRVCLIE